MLCHPFAEVGDAFLIQKDRRILRPQLFDFRGKLKLSIVIIDLLLGGQANRFEVPGPISFALVSAWLMSRLLVEPVEKLRLAAQSVATGDLDVQIDLLRADEFGPLLKARDLAAIFLVAPTTSHARAATICAHGEGYLYYVSLKGVTGAATLRTPWRSNWRSVVDDVAAAVELLQPAGSEQLAK